MIISSGWILKVPFLYKIAAPINFILPPLAYFYVNSVLYNINTFRKKDIWHLLPFIFFLISYTPFYFISFEDKKLIVEKLFREGRLGKSNDGIIPEVIQFIVREVQSLVYLFFQWRLLFKYYKTNINTDFSKQIDDVYYWLINFTSAITISTFSFVTFVIVSELGDDILINNIICRIASILFSISYFVIASYLLYKPSVLYGFPFLNKKKSSLGQFQQTRIGINVKSYEAEIDLISNFFIEEKPYLKRNLNIYEVALSLQIPARDFSFIINNHFQQRFSDFVNSYRIDYVIKEINEGYLDSFTLESLATQAGFSSITTFNRAFKKFKYISPSEYLLQIKSK